MTGVSGYTGFKYYRYMLNWVKATQTERDVLEYIMGRERPSKKEVIN